MLLKQLYIYYHREYLVYHNPLTQVIRGLLFSLFRHNNICVARHAYIMYTENPTSPI